MRKHYIKSLLFLNIPILLLTLIYLILFFTVFEGGEVSFCFIKEHFNLYCPGCGGSRALLALVRLDFFESFMLFPPLIIGVLIVFELDFRMALCTAKNTDKYIRGYSFKRFYILAAALILNFILRNVLLYFFHIDFIGDIHRV